MKDYIIVILVMAVALAMDAFAVSITLGIDCAIRSVRTCLKIALSFGFFQGLLFIIGVKLLSLVSGPVTTYNHFIAGGILILLGVRMIKEAFGRDNDRCLYDNCRQRKCKETRCLKTGKLKKLTYQMLVIYGITTSIDALAAGITYGLTYDFVLLPSIIITAVAFFLSLIGVVFGKKLGSFIGNKANIVGGFILIGLGFNALFF